MAREKIAGIFCRLICLSAAVLAAGACSQRPLKLGSTQSATQSTRDAAVVLSRVQVWGADQDPTLALPLDSTALNQHLTTLRQQNLSSPCGVPVASVSPRQSALFDQIAVLLASTPQQDLSPFRLGPIEGLPETCKEIQMLTGRLGGNLRGWMAAGRLRAVDGALLSLTIASMGAVANINAKQVSSLIGQLLGSPQTVPASAIPPLSRSNAMSRLSDKVIKGYQRQGQILGMTQGMTLALQTVAQQVSEHFPNQPFEVILLDDPDANAKAYPGGQIAVNLGLFLKLHTQDEYAFVLAHELAHLALGHFDQRADTPDAHQQLELEADRKALEIADQAGWDLTAIQGLIRRTRDTADTDQHAKATAAAPGGEGSRLWQQTAQTLQASALDLTIESGNLDSASLFLDQHQQRFTPEQLSRWRWMITQHRDPAPPDDRPLTPGIPASAAAQLPTGVGGCAATVEMTPALPGPGADRGRKKRFHAIGFHQPKHWQTALQTGQQRVMTPDRAGLTRLDLWRPDTRPAGEPARKLPCPVSRHTLWHTLYEYRRLAPDRKLRLISARAVPGGIALDLEMTDESGLEWRLTGWRLERGSAVVYALYRAPSDYFFQRHLPAAAALVENLTVDG